MTYEEAKAKIKSLLMAEIDRLPSHYDIDIKEEVYSDIAEVNELLKLNKIVCEALEKQIPKKPINVEDKMWTCPVCHNHLLGLPHCMLCGQAIDWSDDDE